MLESDCTGFHRGRSYLRDQMVELFVWLTVNLLATKHWLIPRMQILFTQNIIKMRLARF